MCYPMDAEQFTASRWSLSFILPFSNSSSLYHSDLGGDAKGREVEIKTLVLKLF